MIVDECVYGYENILDSLIEMFYSKDDLDFKFCINLIHLDHLGYFYNYIKNLSLLRRYTYHIELDYQQSQLCVKITKTND